MKKVIDRFLAEDTNGRLFTVMCIKEYEDANDLGTTVREIGISFQTSSGEVLTTTNNSSFNIADTSRSLRRVGVERTSQGILRLRGVALGM